MLHPLKSPIVVVAAIAAACLVSWSCGEPPAPRATSHAASEETREEWEWRVPQREPPPGNEVAPLAILEVSISEIALKNRGETIPRANHNALRFRLDHPAENITFLETIKVFPMDPPTSTTTDDEDWDRTVLKVALRGRSRLTVTALAGRLPKPRRPFRGLGADLATKWAGTAGWIEGSVVGALVDLVTRSKGELHAIGEGSVVLDSRDIEPYVELPLVVESELNSYTPNGSRRVVVEKGDNGKIRLHLRVLAGAPDHQQGARVRATDVAAEVQEVARAPG